MLEEKIFNQKHLTFKKKTKLVIHQLGLASNNYQTKYEKNDKLRYRKLSEIDLRATLLHNQNDKKINQYKQTQNPQILSYQENNSALTRTLSIPNILNIQKFLFLQCKDGKKQKTVSNDKKIKKGKEPTYKQQFLLPAIRNSLNEERRIQKQDQNIMFENQFNSTNIKNQKVQTDNYNLKNNIQQVRFRKMKSESLMHLQHKFKLNNATKNKKIFNNYEQQLNEAKNTKRKEQAQIQKNIQNIQNNLIQQKKPKKFFITNINLQNFSYSNQVLNKKNYILQLVQKREKQYNLKLTNKKILPNIIKLQEKQANHMHPLTLIQENSTITKKAIVNQPNQLLLKKMCVNSQNVSKQQKYQRFIHMNKTPLLKNNSRLNPKYNINGWEVERQLQCNQLLIDNQLVNQVY